MDILLEQIEVDIENANYDDIKIYGEIIVGLQKLFKEKYFNDIIGAYNKLKEEAENWNDFETIRNEALRNPGDVDLAEDIAWNLMLS